MRTDFGDEGAWTALKHALSLPWGPGDFEPRVQVVDDPSWAGLTTADVLAAVSTDDVGVHEIHANLMIANLDFADFADAADAAPNGVFRSL
ncbi:DUF6924 domain-containing protein [Streptomyces mirabilis]|uniref:DUF6924 domain-containing protein n=1 Tax=Streptomyces mirabilis TaxID=68239 RepID=UPI00368361AF